MKNKRSIRQKIILYILSVFSFFYVVSIGYIVVNSRQTILNETLEKTELLAENSASEISRFIEKNITITRTLAQALSVYQQMPSEQWTELFLKMYEPVLEANPHVYILWDSWEYYGFVPNYNKEFGRILMYVLREDNNTFTSAKEERSMDGDPDLYGAFKRGNADDVWEPYLDVVEDGSREARMMTTIASPIQIDGRFMGLIGLDLELTALQDLVSKVETLEGGFAFLLSYEGIVAGHPNSELISKSIGDLYPNVAEQEKIIDRVQKGEEFTFVRTEVDGSTHYMFFTPVLVDGIDKSWSLAISIPYRQVMKTANSMLYISLAVGLVALLVIVIILIIISNSLTKPIVGITNSLKRMANGEISKDLVLDIKSNDEIEEMAEAFNRSIDGLNQKTSFALDIGNGQLESSLELLSEKDILGTSLIDMRNSLKQAKVDEEKRKEEDRKRAWANEGFAKFADILRHNNDDIQQLSDDIVKNVVKYLEANQAAMFVLNDEERGEKYFELLSAYAWDRKKYLNKKIDTKEGLIGACALEKETIQLTEIPEDYVEITSGLGKATPRYVILVPLKHEDNVLGVIEMASFNVFEPFEVEFLERIAESIASTLLSVRINAKTKMLLEQSQQQAEEMQAQEEEMRQNMEELQATQEEMERKRSEQEKIQQELQQELTLLNALMDNIPDYIYFKDDRSRFIRISKSMVKLFNADSPEELVGKSDFDFHTKDNAQKFYNEEQEIMHSKTAIVDRVARETFDDGKDNWVSATKMPLFDMDGRVVGTWGISRIITDLKEAEQNLENLAQQVEEYQAFVKVVDSSTCVVEYNPKGEIIRANDQFSSIIGLPVNDLIGKHHSELYTLLGVKQAESKSLWADLSKGIVRHQLFKAKVDKIEITLTETYSPITDATGNVVKVIAIAAKV
ncbi:MAG: PAS domain-containing protein [Tenuifilaceae bacterium]|jgi:PAS domain S-box-containing protein|nr:PAS domain-containing protein [Tenuifilaceae bacterium]